MYKFSIFSQLLYPVRKNLSSKKPGYKPARPGPATFIDELGSNSDYDKTSVIFKNTKFTVVYRKKRVVYIRNVEFQLTIKRQLQSHFLVVFCSPSCPLNLQKVNSRDNNWRSNIDSERVALTMIPTRKAKFGA